MDAKLTAPRGTGIIEVRRVPVSTTEQTRTRQEIKVTIDYLPAAEDFHQDYPPETILETIRGDAKGFFAVQDRQERDRYFYYLAHHGQRIQDTSTTLGQLIGPHPHAAHFSLVEEIIAGTDA
jgi:hypothetical protein